jgi:hypothetical protein
MKRFVTRALILVAAILGMMFAQVAPIGVATATADTGGGNSANVKLCQNGGWQTLFRADGTGFASYQNCASYGATGGTILTSPPASQSQTDCERYGGQFSTTNDPFGGPGIFLWSCSGYDQATAGNTIAQDCFDDGGIPNSFFDSNGVLRGTSCYE